MKGIKTDTQKLQAILVLKDARRLVASGAESWVCCAIDDVSNQNCIHNSNNRHRYPKTEAREQIGKALKAEIHSRIGDHYLVTSWLRQQPGVDPSEVDDYENARQYRLRWIDSMIAELQ